MHWLGKGAKPVAPSQRTTSRLREKHQPGPRDPVAISWRLRALRSEPRGGRSTRPPTFWKSSGGSRHGDVSEASDPGTKLLLFVRAAARQLLFAASLWAARFGGPRRGRQDRA